MARKKRTDGYASRLTLALERGPNPMSVRQLAAELGGDKRRGIEGRYPDLRGRSYGGVRQYVEGKVVNPRIEVLRAMAEVLGVRADWLAFDEGAMTEPQEQARLKVLRIAEAGLPAAEDLQAAHLRDTVLDALGLPPAPVPVVGERGVVRGRSASPIPTWVGPLAQVWLAATTADIAAGTNVVDADLEQSIGTALAGPLAALGVRADALDRRGLLGRYVLTMIPALLLVADQRNRLSRAKEGDDGQS